MKQSKRLRVSLIIVVVTLFALVPAVTLGMETESEPAAADSTEAEEAEVSDEGDGEEVSMEEMLVDEDGYESEGEGSDADGNAGDWTWRITRSAFWGGVTGALIGVGLFLVGGDRFDDGVIIAQLAGGGILVGAGLGLIAVLTDSGDSTQSMEHPSSVQWIERDLPRTYEFNIIDLEY